MSEPQTGEVTTAQTGEGDCTSESPDYPGLTCHRADPHTMHYALGCTWYDAPQTDARVS